MSKINIISEKSSFSVTLAFLLKCQSKIWLCDALKKTSKNNFHFGYHYFGIIFCATSCMALHSQSVPSKSYKNQVISSSLTKHSQNGKIQQFLQIWQHKLYYTSEEDIINMWFVLWYFKKFVKYLVPLWNLLKGVTSP